MALLSKLDDLDEIDELDELDELDDWVDQTPALYNGLCVLVLFYHMVYKNMQIDAEY